MGIMIDTGAAIRSTAREGQFQALQRIQDVRLDKSRAGEANITFGIGQTSSLGTVDVSTPVGQITFHVVPADVPFLFCLADIDRLRVKFDNLDNIVIQGNQKTPVVRAFGHPWLLLDPLQSLVHTSPRDTNWGNELVTCHLTEVELRQLHRRFGHPSAGRFIRVLERAG